METERMLLKRKNLKNSKREWIAVVLNMDKGVRVETKFNSQEHEIANVIHKIELDLMSNLELGLQNPIGVVIKEIPGEQNA